MVTVSSSVLNLGEIILSISSTPHWWECSLRYHFQLTMTIIIGTPRAYTQRHNRQVASSILRGSSCGKGMHLIQSSLRESAPAFSSPGKAFSWKWGFFVPYCAVGYELFSNLVPSWRVRFPPDQVCLPFWDSNHRSWVTIPPPEIWLIEILLSYLHPMYSRNKNTWLKTLCILDHRLCNYARYVSGWTPHSSHKTKRWLLQKHFKFLLLLQFPFIPKSNLPTPCRLTN